MAPGSVKCAWPKALSLAVCPPLFSSTLTHCLPSPLLPLPVMLNGEKVNEDDTPESLDMEEGDVIDALLQQTGGAQ